MPCEPAEYHPYAACLMFKGCHNSATVRANLAPLAAAIARAEAAERDAERYRWLRDSCRPLDNGNDDPHARIRICTGEFQDGVGWFELIGPTSHVGIITLDAAIDAAIAAQQAEGEGRG